jgi:hypothetical protein
VITEGSSSAGLGGVPAASGSSSRSRGDACGPSTANRQLPSAQLSGASLIASSKLRRRGNGEHQFPFLVPAVTCCLGQCVRSTVTPSENMLSWSSALTAVSPRGRSKKSSPRTVFPGLMSLRNTPPLLPGLPSMSA